MAPRLDKRPAAQANGHTPARALLKDRAYERIKHRLLNDDYPPGSFLSERQLAERLGMSKTPVKAALERLESEGFIVIRFAVSILALVVAVFAWQAKQWWWLIGLVPIAVLWNPAFPIDLGIPALWLALQYVGALVFLVAGWFIRVEERVDKNGKPVKSA